MGTGKRIAQCEGRRPTSRSPAETIQSLASDLAALTARVAKREGQIVAADLVGTYALHDGHTRCSARGREQHGFREELPHQLRATHAQSGANHRA